MTQVLVVVLRDPDLMPALLEAWQDAGVLGVTIMRSAGVSQARPWFQLLGHQGSEPAPEMTNLTQRTLFAVIQDEDVLARAVGEAGRIVGDFDLPGNGLLMVLPVDRVLGARSAKKESALAPTTDDPPIASSAAWTIKRNTPVKVVAQLLNLEPTIVRLDASMYEVAQAMLKHPAVHVACVVDGDDYLVGLIDLRTLADQLFFHILPEEFLSEISDLENAMRFADFGRQRTAKDAMKAPVWMKLDKPVKEAFRRMHDHQIPGLPIVDDAHHVIGYINLLELLSICTEGASETTDDSEIL